MQILVDSLVIHTKHCTDFIHANIIVYYPKLAGPDQSIVSLYFDEWHPPSSLMNGIRSILANLMAILFPDWTHACITDQLEVGLQKRGGYNLERSSGVWSPNLFESHGPRLARLVELVDAARPVLEKREAPEHVLVVVLHAVEDAPPLVHRPHGFFRLEVLLAVCEARLRIIYYSSVGRSVFGSMTWRSRH